MPTKPCVCMGLTNRIDRPVTGCRVIARQGTSSYFLSVTPLSSPYRRSPAGPVLRPCRPVRPDRSCFLAPQGLISSAHVGEHGAALLRGHLLRVQHGQQRQRILEGRISVPVGG